MNLIYTSLSLVALTLASACATSGLIDTTRLDPLNAPPGALGLAVAVPDAIVLNNSDAVLRIAFAEGAQTLVGTDVPLSVRPGLADTHVP